MSMLTLVHGSVAEEALVEDYETILNSASTELTETEYRHLTDIANIGYEYARQKEDYVIAMHESISAWLVESRRENLHLLPSSTDIDFESLYNRSIEVKDHMAQNHNSNAIPLFFACFGAVVLALFCIFSTILVCGILQHAFPFNPIYLFMFAIGFLGLLITDIVAIADWRKGQNGQKERRN